MAQGRGQGWGLSSYNKRTVPENPQVLKESNLVSNMKQVNYLWWPVLLCGLGLLLAACGYDSQLEVSRPTDQANIVSLPTPSTRQIGQRPQNTPDPGLVPSPSLPPPTPTIQPTPTEVLPTATALPTSPPKQTPTPTLVTYPKPALNIAQVGPTRPVPEYSGTGEVTERDFYSPLLKKIEPYRIYLPANYHTSQERYPVLYMLHGYSGKVDEWMWYGIFDRYEELLAKNQVKSYIIVLPCGEQEYWVDHPNDGLRWGDYMAHEVVAHIDGNYRTIPLKESRAIGGLSMGGNGALQIAMNYPDIFGIVGAHSPTMRTFDQKIPWWGDLNWFLAHDPVAMVKTNQSITQVKLWVDDGNDDKVWRPRVLQMKQNLDDRKINYVWQSWAGDHDASYWRAHVADYLQWYNGVLDFKK